MSDSNGLEAKFGRVPELSPKLPSSGIYPSAALSRTKEAWNDFQQDNGEDINELPDKLESVKSNCDDTSQGDVQNLERRVQFFQDWQQQAEGSHEKVLSETVSLQSGKAYVFVVEEHLE